MLVAAFFFWLLGFAFFWRLPSIGAVSEDERTVSVVIPARDEEANIGRLLESLSCQTPPPCHVITVDDHSSDATAERARAAGAIVEGYARSFATGAGATPAWLLMAVVAWIVGAITTTRHLLVGLLGAGDVPVLAIGLALLYAGQLRWMLDRIGNFGWWPALVFPIPVVYFVGVFSLSLFRTLIRPRVSWKGRSVLTK